MSTTTTTDDFRSTKTFAAAPDAVFSALTDIDALTGWWTPAAGGAHAGETLRFLMGDQEVVMRVDEADRPSRVHWSVLVCEAAPDWVGTSITFDLEPVAPAPSCASTTTASTPVSSASRPATLGGRATWPALSITSTGAPATRTHPPTGSPPGAPSTPPIEQAWTAEVASR